MIEPKVVFEPVLGRWRVEYRTRQSDEWQTEVYASTLEEAREVAQEMTNHDLDGAYRVVDTQPEDDTQPDTVRMGDETPLTLIHPLAFDAADVERAARALTEARYEGCPLEDLADIHLAEMLDQARAVLGAVGSVEA